MTKTVLLAAALLSLGVSAAFADGDVKAPPAADATAAAAPAHQPPIGRSDLNVTKQNSNVWVYDQFGYSGATQGGQN